MSGIKHVQPGVFVVEIDGRECQVEIPPPTQRSLADLFRERMERKRQEVKEIKDRRHAQMEKDLKVGEDGMFAVQPMMAPSGLMFYMDFQKERIMAELGVTEADLKEETSRLVFDVKKLWGDEDG